TYLSENNYIKKEIPKYVTDNINPRFKIRGYQHEAMIRLIHYNESYNRKKKPVHLLFNMATGSGKTLLMAMNILYLYKKGYRNFLFFVNSTNIIEKTKDNFLNPYSSKYLFNEKIIFDNREVKIKEVSNFDESNPDSINILFLTIQGLYSQLTNLRENSITIEDFTNKKIVLISDEAHHINSMTKKKLNKEEELIENTWEYWVMSILKLNPENILLEYTATMEFEKREIFQKYQDKLIFRYDLKSFRDDGYSKDVDILKLDADTWERMLTAVILSQYRRKIAERNKIYLKPVVLFRSRTIEESESNFIVFVNGIENLNIDDIEQIRKLNQGTIVEKAFNFFRKENISDEMLIAELKEDFSREKCPLLVKSI
ncbi:MAG: DEAD/DEAH box helicase family protein, partial [Caldanaerobacter sp.]